jgi:two-component system phosphate regulon sensor histidine kinase PhoR
MKLNRTHVFIAMSSLALVVVLVIQVNWILHTARIKEELFNEKANMVLTRTAEALSSDTQACRNLEAGVEAAEVRKIDSLFVHYMKFYNFHIDYSFEVSKPDLFGMKQSVSANNVYNKRLDEVVSNNGLELKLTFPEKKKFIIAEMGPMFITSVVLILVVLVMFWRTVLSLLKKKEILEHTTEFLNNMTHEFKTPLTNIALASKMIVKEAMIRQEDKIKHYSGIILEENEKLRLQVEHMLSMTALERGELRLQKTEVDMHQLIEEAVKCIGVQIEHAQGNMKLDLNADQFVVMGDKTYLTNALCNLLDNAIKYSPGKPELSVQTLNDGKYLLLKVSDKGIGISKEYHKKVFDTFFRVPTGDVHDVKGFGMGLAYVKKIIELHDGSIGLQSEKERGTNMTITLPYA